jgi:hypothetical protein
MITLRTFYIVAGLPRSGTSMMMHCINESSSLILMGDRNIERLPCGLDGLQRPRTTDYDFNPHGIYEVNRPVVWPMLPDRALVKRLLTTDVIPTTYDGVTYRVCVISRNRQEVRESWQRTFDHAFNEKRFAIAESDKNNYRSRDDMDVVEVNYRYTIENPITTFQLLIEHGWPLDAEKAASLVDPALYRHRAD